MSVVNLTLARREDGQVYSVLLMRHSHVNGSPKRSPDGNSEEWRPISGVEMSEAPPAYLTRMNPTSPAPPSSGLTDQFISSRFTADAAVTGSEMRPGSAGPLSYQPRLRSGVSGSGGSKVPATSQHAVLQGYNPNTWDPLCDMAML